PMGPGGKHHAMGTHNRLLSLGPGRFLEVIAIDPDAPAPGRPRWFDLDAPPMRARLAAGPALVHWVARTDDIEGALAAAAGPEVEVLALARGAFRWKIGVPADGALPMAGTAPSLIQWFSRHPAEVLEDAGCRLEALVLRHPHVTATLHALRFAGLDPDDPVEAHHEGAGLEARIRTPRGVVELRE
ncbi:MAG TPA: VOC family protein, partial [Myxococcota bacterium]|nr:VOC family protein [Myxococcota bacterium]